MGGKIALARRRHTWFELAKAVGIGLVFETVGVATPFLSTLMRIGIVAFCTLELQRFFEKQLRWASHSFEALAGRQLNNGGNFTNLIQVGQARFLLMFRHLKKKPI